MEVVGTSPTQVSAKVWRAGTSRADRLDGAPASTAPPALQAAGHVGVFAYLPGTASATAPVTVSSDDLRW